MKPPCRYWLLCLLACLFAGVAAMAQQSAVAPQHSQEKKTYSAKAQERIVREVRHKLMMLPYYGDAFDHIAFKLQGYDVVLMGQVVRATLKHDAEHAVKDVEGVERVINHIEILPPSSGDDRIRRAAYRAIYGYSPLQKYGVGSNRSIHILVKNGHITLEGLVNNKADKNMAGIRANGVPGVFSVTNNLEVESNGKGL